MPLLPVAAQLREPPANGSLFGAHVPGLLSGEEVADPGLILRRDGCFPYIMATIHANAARQLEVAESVGFQNDVIDEAFLACLFLRARRNSPLVANSFTTATLTTAIIVLNVAAHEQAPLIANVRELNPEISIAQALFHLLAARLWAAVQLGITTMVIPAGIVPPLNQPPGLPPPIVVAPPVVVAPPNAEVAAQAGINFMMQAAQMAQAQQADAAPEVGINPAPPLPAQGGGAAMVLPPPPVDMALHAPGNPVYQVYEGNAGDGGKLHATFGHLYMSCIYCPIHICDGSTLSMLLHQVEAPPWSPTGRPVLQEVSSIALNSPTTLLTPTPS